MATDTDRLLAKIEEMLAVEASARAELETCSRVEWLDFTMQAQLAHRPLLELVRALVAERRRANAAVDNSAEESLELWLMAKQRTDAAIRAFLEEK